MIMLQLTKSNKKNCRANIYAIDGRMPWLTPLRRWDSLTMENLHMYSSPFYLELKEIVVWAFGVIVKGLLLNRGWMLKTFHGSSYFCSEYETVYFYYGTVTISYLKMNQNKASFSEMILPPPNLDLLLRKFKSFI